MLEPDFELATQELVDQNLSLRRSVAQLLSERGPQFFATGNEMDADAGAHWLSKLIGLGP